MDKSFHPQHYDRCNYLSLCTGNTIKQGLRSHGFDLVIPEYFGVRSWRINALAIDAHFEISIFIGVVRSELPSAVAKFMKSLSQIIAKKYLRKISMKYVAAYLLLSAVFPSCSKVTVSPETKRGMRFNCWQGCMTVVITIYKIFIKRAIPIKRTNHQIGIHITKKLCWLI